MSSKRRRLILSCVSCRTRKVGCDRREPCIRCQKSGRAETCTYGPLSESLSSPATVEQEVSSSHNAGDLNSEQNIGTESSCYGQSELPGHVFQRQSIETESYVKSAGAQPFSSEKYLGLTHPAGPGASQYNRESQHLEQPLQHEQAFNTQHFGPSHVIGLLLQCEGLSSFIRKVLVNVPLPNQWRGQHQSSVAKSVIKRDYYREPLSKEQLISLMPSRARADRLVHMYVNVFESTYRVLHVPTFLRRYGSFWEVPNVTPDSTIVQILLVMAAMNAFVPGGDDGFIGLSSAARIRAKSWVRAAEGWLGAQASKYYTLDTLQNQVLLYHAKKMNCMERKRRWTSVGTLLRSFMAAGLHREPVHLNPNISFYNAEMRRRLWYTAMELELQESCDRGAQPMFNGDTWDCLPPLNISDEDFNEATLSAPVQKPPDSYTRTSFLSTAHSHLVLRVDVLKEINSVRNPMDINTAKKYVERLKDSIDTLPRWPEESTSTVATVLSRLILYEHILILQQPFATQSSLNKGSITSTIQRHAAIFTMESYRSLSHPEALHLFNFRGDGFRAILTLCYEALCLSNPAHRLLHNTEAEIALIEYTVNLLRDRVKSLGQGFQFYWLASAALRLIQARCSESPDEDLLAMKTSESVRSLLTYIKHQRELFEARTLRETIDSNRDFQEMQQIPMFSNCLEAFNNTVDCHSDNWILSSDIGDIWKLDGL